LENGINQTNAGYFEAFPKAGIRDRNIFGQSAFEIKICILLEKPFMWPATADSIFGRLEGLCEAISEPAR